MKHIKNKNRLSNKCNHIIKLYAPILLIFIFSTLAVAQKNTNGALNFGVGYSSFLSGNGHGTFYSFYLNIDRKKSNFNIGPCVQKSSHQIGSIKCSYSYVLADNGRRLKLRGFTYLFYANKLPLSYSTSKLEEREETSSQKWESKPPTDWENVKLSTIEMGYGVELEIRVIQSIVLRNFIGLSVFYHNAYKEGMYSDRIAPVLTFGCSLNIYNNYSKNYNSGTNKIQFNF